MLISEISSLKQKFAKINVSIWKKRVDSLNVKKGKTLLYVTRHDITVLIDAMLFSKRLCTNRSKLFVGLDEPTDMSTRQVYESFCIDGFINMYITSWLIKIYCFVLAFRIWFGIKNPNDILNISYKDIFIGEDLYDAIIRNDVKLYTVDKINIHVCKMIYGCILKIYSMEHLVKKYGIDTFVYFDCDYDRNMFFKVAAKHNLTIYQVVGGNVYRHDERKNYKEISCATITLDMYKKFSAAPMDSINTTLKMHFLGERKGFLDATAYQKNQYSRKMLFDACGVKTNNKLMNVLIAAHAFSDRPHYGKRMIYRDYYQWLLQTIKILGDEHNLNVFVKEHPSAHFYHEKGTVSYICSSLGIDNVYVIPEDCNTISLFEIMDVVITCQGTIGIEAVIHGIPVVTAGQGYYYGYGIDNNASTVEEYIDMLHHLDHLPSVSDKQKEIARVLLYIKNKLFFSKHSSVYDIAKMAGMSQLDEYRYICKQMDAGKNLIDDYYKTILDDIIVYSDDIYDKLKSYKQSIFYNI